MKRLAMTAMAAALLAACAAAPESLTEAETQPSAQSPRLSDSLESLQIAGTVELRPRFGDEAKEPECRKGKATGSHIVRMRCPKPRSELEEHLDEEYARVQLDMAREMALREEQRRMEQAAEERLREQMMGQRMMEMMRR